MAAEQFVAKVVGEMIPEAKGIARPTVSSPNDQIFCSLCDIRGAGGCGDGVAEFCSHGEGERGYCAGKGRSARSPGRFSKLRRTGLAGIGDRVFANRQFGSKDRGCSACDRAPLMPCPIAQNEVQIDRAHAGAVCKEIGERLSVALGPQSIELQPRLLSLMKQLSEQAETEPPEPAAL